jgi:hypothetical protein
MRFPEWVVPMAARLTDRRFSTPEWVFERKYDGIRLLAFRKGKTVRLFSRNQLPQSYPEVAAAIGALSVAQVILDGEVDWGDRNLEYHVFDVLWLNGRDLMPEDDVVGIGPVVVQAFPDAAGAFRDVGLRGATVMHLQVLVSAVAKKLRAARPEVGEPGNVLLGR